MIPKIIHYCWFGQNKKPDYFLKCRKSWVKYFPGFTLMEWNETNTDFDHPFLKEAVKQKKWAFVSDFVRIKVLDEFGGIYLDTDMLFIKYFDFNLLKNQFFVGMEDSKSLNAAVFGTVKGDRLVRVIFEKYKSIDSFDFDHLTIPNILQFVFENLLKIDIKPGPVLGGYILKYSIFYPLPFKLRNFHWKKFVFQETLAVHLWAGSWLVDQEIPIEERLFSYLKYHISRYYVPVSLIKYSRNI